MSQAYPSFSCSKLTTHRTQVVVLLSSFLINGDEVYTSRMILMLAPVLASALSICSSLLTMRLTTN
jgi:hypothetical protein